MRKNKSLPSETIDFGKYEIASKGQLKAPRQNGTWASTWSTAPGDVAQLLVGRSRKGARESWLQTVVTPGPNRVAPICPHFARCGGCAWQHLTYPAQLELKTAPLAQALRELGGPEFELLPPCPSPKPWHYRSKIELSFLNDDLGFIRRGCFGRSVPVTECFIGPSANREIIAITRAWFKRHGLSCWDTKSNTGMLRYLIIRQSSFDQGVLVALVCSPDCPDAALQELSQELADLPAVRGFVQAVQTSVASAVVVDEVRVLYGENHLQERLGELKFELNFQSFFQSNPPAFANMLRTITGWLPVNGHLLDLYCGVGTIGLTLALHSGCSLTGVESVAPAVKDAQANAERAGIKADFHCGNSEDWPDLNCDVLVLDPPRSGCHPKMISRLLTEGPERVLYISCNPKRFLEEFQTLKEAYRLERAQMFDFFPQTPHVETCVLLGLKDVDEYIYIDYEPDHHIKRGRATYREVKEYVLKNYGLKVSSLDIAQIKDKCGFEKRDNYNKGKEGHRVPICTPEKEDAIMEAFKHFNMI